MEQTESMASKLSAYIAEWNEILSDVCRRCDEFSVVPYKNKLLEEIGNDDFAREAFYLFHNYDFTRLINYWIENHQNMNEENAERFKGLLIAIAPMLLPDYMPGTIEPEIFEQEKDIQKIIAIVGGDRMAIRKGDIKFPRFCFEIMFCALVDTDMRGCGFELLSQSCKCICESLCQGFEWNGKNEEAALMRIVDLCEDVGGHCGFTTIWPNWRATR
jgi:hypothetical protein